MEEQISLVSQKAGISNDQAKTAVTTVLIFLKEKLPAPLAGQIDSLKTGGASTSAAESLGGLFSKK
jgi:hypothetical protein